MNITVVSSLEKVLLGRQIPTAWDREISCLGGEEFAWQVILQREGWGPAPVKVWVESPLKEYVEVFQVGQVPCAMPAYPSAVKDENYLTTQPGLFPDPLLPLEEGQVEASAFLPTVLWVNGRVPQGFPAGEYPVTLHLSGGGEEAVCQVTLRVVGVDLPAQRLTYTQWFHGDCLADYYGVPVYSSKHWELWESFLKAAAEEGMNMVLTPVFTPPLDTEPGRTRPCTQLVQVEKEGDTYRFDFSLLERFIAMARRCGVERFEISHLFTQWGAKAAPAIYGTEAGEYRRLFGWDTPADSPEYAGFLKQFLPSLTMFLEKQGLAGKAVFHISDEPGEEHLDSYRKAKELAKAYQGDFPLYDALSETAFYDRGLVEHPVAATDHIQPFLDRKVPDLWAYYCCAQGVDVANRFLAMPSARNRILGWQLHKFQVAGFLHWGYNFWYSQNSRQKLDPWRVTDALGAFPGGDAFSVYPGKDGPIQSLRMKVFHHGLQDLRALELAQSLLGEDPGALTLPGYGEMTFSRYPQEGKTLLTAREHLNRLIEKRL
jgi:hypothetical protein